MNAYDKEYPDEIQVRAQIRREYNRDVEAALKAIYAKARRDHANTPTKLTPATTCDILAFQDS